MKVRELALKIGLRFEGDGEREITGAAPVDSASPEDLTFAGPKAFAAARAADISFRSPIVVQRLTKTYGSKWQFAPMTTSCSMTQKSATMQPGPITASGCTRAVEAMEHDGS